MSAPLQLVVQLRELCFDEQVMPNVHRANTRGDRADNNQSTDNHFYSTSFATLCKKALTMCSTLSTSTTYFTILSTPGRSPKLSTAAVTFSASASSFSTSASSPAGTVAIFILSCSSGSSTHKWWTAALISAGSAASSCAIYFSTSGSSAAIARATASFNASESSVDAVVSICPTVALITSWASTTMVMVTGLTAGIRGAGLTGGGVVGVAPDGCGGGAPLMTMSAISSAPIPLCAYESDEAPC